MSMASCAITGCRNPACSHVRWAGSSDQPQYANLCEEHKTELWDRMNPLLKAGRGHWTQGPPDSFADEITAASTPSKLAPTTRRSSPPPLPWPDRLPILRLLRWRCRTACCNKREWIWTRVCRQCRLSGLIGWRTQVCFNGNALCRRCGKQRLHGGPVVKCAACGYVAEAPGGSHSR